MFGTFRYLLALLVVHGHVHWSLFGQINWVGWYAVDAFFVLSGFLMTRVLHENYGYDSSGTARFLLNRMLRIYPPYWIAVLTSAAILLVTPYNGVFKATFYLPTDAWSWTTNLLIFGMLEHRPALVGPAWSLHVEWVFYLLMAFGASRNRRMTLAWLGFGVLWTVWAAAAGFPLADRLGTEVSASLPFSLGAAAYFFRQSTPRWSLLFPALFFVHAFCASLIWNDATVTGFYVSLGLATASAFALAGRQPAGAMADWDRRLADLSYPIFLLHFSIAYALVGLAPSLESDLSTWFLATVVAVHLPAIAMQRLVESPLETIRSRIRRVTERRRGEGATPSEGSRYHEAHHWWMAALPGAAAILLHVGLYKVLAFKLPSDHAEFLSGMAFTFFGLGVMGSQSVQKRFGTAGREFTERACVTSGVAITTGLLVLCRAPVDPEHIRDWSIGLLPYLGVAATVCLIWLVTGFAVGAIIRGAGDSRVRSTASLSLGAAMGAPLALWCLPTIGAPGLVFAAAAVLLVPVTRNAGRRGRAGLAIAWLVLLALSPSAQPTIRPLPTKAMTTPTGMAPGTEFTKWGVLHRIDAHRSSVNADLLFIDNDGDAAGTLPLLAADEPITSLSSPPEQRLPYAAAGKPGESALILGAGAATQLSAVLAAGAAQVTTVDPEPLARQVLSGPLARQTGALSERPGVTAISDDPRSWLESTDLEFDVIRWTPSIGDYRPASLGASHLDSESFLHTGEGILLCLEHLARGGLLVATFAGSADSPGASGAKRFLQTVQQVLGGAGSLDTGDHVFIVVTGNQPTWTHVMLGKDPPAPSMANRIRSLTASIPGAVLVHAPDARVASGPLAALLQRPGAKVADDASSDRAASSTPAVRVASSTSVTRDASPYSFGGAELAGAIGLASPHTDVTRADAATARLLFTQAMLAVALALVATLAALIAGVGGAPRDASARRVIASCLGGVGSALAASASVHAITLTRGSLVEAWAITMAALPAAGALVLLVLDRVRHRRVPVQVTGDSASGVVRYGVFLCWLAAGSSLVSLIAITSGFPIMRWLAGACFLTVGLLYAGRRQRIEEDAA